MSSAGSTRFLRITIDINLKWTEHQYEISKKLIQQYLCPIRYYTIFILKSFTVLLRQSKILPFFM